MSNTKPCDRDHSKYKICIKYKHFMENKRKILNNSGAWVGVGAAIGTSIYAITNEPTWIAVGVAIGAALSWRNPKKSKDQ